MWKYPASKSNIRLAVAGWISGICLFAHCAETTSDIVIYGSSPAAISAAVQAKRMGKSAVIVSPETRIGGLATGGLGQTDIGNKSAFGGIALEFYRDVAKWYADPAHWTRQTAAEYRPDGQTKGTMGTGSMWTFEPSAALAILEGWERRDKLDIRRGEWLDREKGVEKKGGRIVSIKTLSGNVYRGKVFIDATYEGDLMAAAGVSYTVGREANSVYGETVNGIQRKRAKYHKNGKMHQIRSGISAYVKPGDPSSGLLPGVEPDTDEPDGAGDSRVQAYCFRMCLTDDPENRIPFKKPANYNALDYEILLRNLEDITPEEFAGRKPNPNGFVPWINSMMPNRKTDTNNRTGFSTDFVGQNHRWPEASYAEREKILKAHLEYQQGLMWTLANDPRVPEPIRSEVAKWGTCKDEFLDGPGDGWQSQLYVREARRMVGEYVATEHDVLRNRTAPRPVAMAAYGMDSHHVRRYVGKDGCVRNEGDIEDWRSRGKPYPLDYGVITPKRGDCENLLVPVCVSASHMAFGSIRMEPVFFALGQAAGTAASMAAANGAAVQDVPYAELRERLDADGQVITFANTAVADSCLVEAEAFADKGGWVVDPQFVEQMGSPYLLAHGKGIPVADAKTSVNIKPGRVRAYVRTRDWTPDWNGEKPGRFQLILGGKTFPVTLGVAPATWSWVDAGIVEVGEGPQVLALHDLTGFEGRCASFTHVAFASCRVQHALGQQGVAVGYAASLCKKYGCLPRGIHEDSVKTAELQALMNLKQAEKGMKPYKWPKAT